MPKPEFDEQTKAMMAKHEAMYKDFFLSPGKYYMKPFSIFGNVYYVGDEKVCMHLIDTGDGLIVIDTGFPHATHLLVQAIWEAGFNPRDLKYAIITHGHFDHFGGAKKLKDLYGCKICISDTDAALIEKMLPRKGTLPVEEYPIDVFEPDVLFHDGDTLTLGNTTIETIPVPGHSPGVLAFFFDAVANGEVKKCGLIGGVGLGGMSTKAILARGESLDKQTNFLKALDRIYDRQVDITLGNHPNNNDTIAKAKKLADNPAVNPWIDPTEWQRMIDGLRAQMAKLIADK